MSCLICKEDIGDEPSEKVGQKGLERLIKCILIHQDNLDKEFNETASIILHTYCRKKYTNITVNKNGELKVLSAKCFTPKVAANNFPFVPVNDDYAAFTKYLSSRDTLLNTPETSVPAETGESISNKEEEQQESADNISIRSEQDFSVLSVDSESCALKYNQIIVQDNSLPQLEYYIPVLNGAPSEHGTLEPQYDGSLAESLQVSINKIDHTKPFPFEHLCFICAKDISSKYVENEKKKPANKRNVVHKVFSKSTKDTLMHYLTTNHTFGNQSPAQKSKKDKKEKLQEETAVGDKRKSLRLTDIKKKGKENTKVNTGKEQRGLKRKKRQCKQTLNIDNKTNGTNLLKDAGEMFSDDDYSPDEDGNVIEQNESFVENEYKTMFICRICLSSDRTLDVLGEYSDMYRRICADIVPDDTKLFLVCWECRAVLVQATRFRERAEEAHKLLTSEVRPKCLSTMSMTAPDVSIISSGFSENSFDANDEENSIKKCVEANEYKDLDQEVDVQYSPRPVTEEEGSMDDLNTFDDVWADEEMDRPSDAKRPRRSVVNEEREAKEKESDDDDEDDESTEKSNDSSSETSDADWKSPAPKPTKTRKKRQHSKTKPLPLRFRIQIQDFDVDSKIRREPVAESELSVWLERERQSAYFKLSKLRKCHRCISVIPPGEDHETIYHSKSNPLVCHICKFTCSSEAVLSPHIARHYFVLHCALCSYQCYNELHMRSHVNWHRKTVCCLDCQREFKSEEEFQQHSKQPHKKHAPQVCTVCNATFKSRSYLKKHMDLKHHVERTEAAYCVKCDIQFDNEKLLKQHVYTSVKHASERKPLPSKSKPKVPECHKCPSCPNSYSNAWSLRNHHAFVHEMEIRFYCDQCDKAFPRKDGLQAHMRRHEGYVHPKDKFCHFCGLGFSTRRILIHHIRTHTGERPFACPHPHCGRKFAQKAAMRAHVKHIHEKVQRQPATSSGNT